MFNVLKGKRLSRNPIAETDTIEAPEKRTTKLTPEQIKVVWDAAKKLRPVERDFIHFQMLTAQRVTQCSVLRWDWIDWDDNTILFPASAMKGRKKHTPNYVMPMSKPVIELLKRRKSDSTSVHVFASETGSPISNHSRRAAKLDAAIAGVKYQWNNERRKNVIQFCWHDFRRTANHLLRKRHKIKPYEAKLLIAHKITSDNDPLSSYWDSEEQMIEEKRRLFDLLGDEIMKCVE